MTDKRRTFLAAGLCAAATVALLLATASGVGITWDEPAYFAAQDSYAAWAGKLLTDPLDALRPVTVSRHFVVNREHPPLAKLFSGIVAAAARPLLGFPLADRLGGTFLAGSLVFALVLLVGGIAGARAGVLAAAALLAMPRFFFHAHLAALDVPAAGAALGVALLFRATADRPGRIWGILLGVAWGLALAVKASPVFVLPALFVFVLLCRREKRLLLRLSVAGLVAIPVFLLVWPWLWPAPVERVVQYVRFLTVDHWEVGQWFRGTLWRPPPPSFPFLMFAAAIPAGLLGAGFLGAVLAARRRETREGGLFLGVHAAVPLLALAAGGAGIYDNDRLLMPAFVFFAGLAGIGLDAAMRTKPGAAVAAAALAWPVVVAAGLWPHGLSYYSELAGGLSGAVRRGYETTYWCETFGAALPALNAAAKPEATVWTEPFTHDVMIAWQRAGRLRGDLRIAAPEGAASLLGGEGRLARIGWREADFVLLQHRETSFATAGAAGPTPADFAGRTPLFTLEKDGVVLLELHER